jgi:RNA polymerase sigma factor (TIGR02999 family)
LIRFAVNWRDDRLDHDLSLCLLTREHSTNCAKVFAPYSVVSVVMVVGEESPMKRDAQRKGGLPIKPAKCDIRTPVCSQNEITHWLIASGAGDPAAQEKLLPLVYDELHRRAMQFFSRERSGHTLQPTALVDEVYLRLVNQREATWQNRAQFFAVAAQTMRRILVSHARARQAAKRGGVEQHITITEELAAGEQRDVNLLALDEALKKLETIDLEKSRMVELRFFSGLSVAETAEVMGVSPRTIDRQWQTAKAWLYKEIAIAE